jgi:Cof subfamily protein (haloacid dehalogenase superfamily)
MLVGMLLAFDLDKTLVTDDYDLPLPIRDAVLAARSAGHAVAVLTGRPLAAATDYLTVLDMSDPFSVNNGALVVGPGGGTLRHMRIDDTVTDEILTSALANPALEFSCVVDDTLYVRDPDDERWAWVHTANRRVERYRGELGLHADKIVFAGAAPALEVELLVRFTDLDTYLWGDGYLEVLPRGADKGSALALIADALSIPQKDTIAFGDGLNDVTMIGWAGHGIAVGPHAHADVLDAASEHIASPEEGGVARWLKENL